MSFPLCRASSCTCRLACSHWQVCTHLGHSTKTQWLSYLSERRPKKNPKLNLNQVAICFVKPLESSLEIPAESAQPSSHRHCKGAALVPDHSFRHLGHWPGVWACGGCVCMCLRTISQTSRDRYGEDHTGEPPRRAVLHACCC